MSLMIKRVRIPITFWSLATTIIDKTKPVYTFTVISQSSSVVLVESQIEGLDWLYKLSFMMMNDMNVSSNYRVTSRRAWWRLKYVLDASNLVHTDVICVDGVYVNLHKN